MKSNQKTDPNPIYDCIYDCIVVGAGASGLFYAACDSVMTSGSSAAGSDGTAVGDDAAVCDGAAWCDGAAGCDGAAVGDDVAVCDGAADRFSAGLGPVPPEFSVRKLILEKTSRPGQKLLMSGNGMCNVTHSGSIKTFINKYGDHGKLIRTALYKHNNLELMSMLENLGVPLTEREDGKIFPASMKAADVRDALISAASSGGWRISCETEVTGITPDPDNGLIRITLRSRDVSLHSTSCNTGTCSSAPSRSDKSGSEPNSAASSGSEHCSDKLPENDIYTRKLVIATGGSSYPATGSDGSFLRVLDRDLGLSIVEPRPALAPVYVQDFKYENLAGISFDDVRIACRKHETRGPLLITHKGFSGPAALHISQYVKPGDELTIGFMADTSAAALAQDLKEKQAGNSTGTANYLAAETQLPKAFVSMVLMELGLDGLSGKKISSLTGAEIEMVAHAITEHAYSVSGTGGWNDAMVTAGGVSLSDIDLKTIQRISGHANISTTLSIYTHSHEEEVQAAGEKLGRLLGA